MTQSMSPNEERIGTGNTQADEILKGGFPRNSINIIMGLPGTGKTIFAEQLAFHNADDTRPILYLTTMSEPLAKVLTYLQRFEFYELTKIGSAIHYQDIGSDLAKDGIEAILSKVNEAIRTISPKIIIIDSFKALHDLEESVPAMRRVLFELTGLLTAYDITAFLLGEYTEDHSKMLPEFAVADGIIQFLRSTHSNRDERFLRVIKLRGSAYAEGLHSFRITSNGLDVYPRLVTPDVPEGYVIRKERVPSGVEGLDEILGGGFWRGSSTLLAGVTGAGKTTFGLQFAIAGLGRDEGQSLVLSFQENPTQLALSINNLTGSDTMPAGLELMYVSPVEMQVDAVIVTLFKRIQQEKIGRVVIDALGDLAVAASDQGRLQDYLYALMQHFAVKGVTSLITFESLGGVSDVGAVSQMGRVSYISDNIILLGLTDRAKRELRCIKARRTKQKRAIHQYQIADSGVQIL